MPNLRRYTPAQVTEIAAAIRRQLGDRNWDHAALRAHLEQFSFRDPSGEFWTRGPVSGAWYVRRKGRWIPADEPQGPLDGPADLRLPVPRSARTTPAGEPAGLDPPASKGDPAAYLEQAVERVAEAYAAGELHSDAAEGLLEDIYAVDASGTAWAPGVQSRRWYMFTESGWQPAQSGPQRSDFLSPESAAGPRHCTNCGESLTEAAKFCANCGQPVPAMPASQSDGAVAEKVTRFLTSGMGLLPEPLIPAWTPPADFPERVHACPHCGALNVGDVESCVSCGKPLGSSGSAESRKPSARPAAGPPKAAPSAPLPVTPPSAPAASAIPAAPAAAPPSNRRWLYIGAASCLLIACACGALLLVLGLLGELPGLSLPLEGAPLVSQLADAPPLEAPPQVVPTTPFALEDTFDDPTRTAVPLFGPELMEFSVDADAGTAVMTAHYHGVLAAMYDSPVARDFVATLELHPLDPAPGAGYGLIFRSDDAFDGLAHYYVALAAPVDQVVTLTRWDQGGAAELIRAPYTPGQGGLIRMTVRADGSRLDLEIDGVSVATVIDESVLGPGIFGLAMYSPRQGDLLSFMSLQVELRDG